MTMLETPGRQQSLVGYYTMKITLLKQMPPIRPVLWGGEATHSGSSTQNLRRRIRERRDRLV